MTEAQTIILTDGSIGLAKGVRDRYGIIVVPRLFRPRWQILRSPSPSLLSAITERRLTARQVYRVQPAAVEHFVTAFNSLPRTGVAVSVHAAAAFDNAFQRAYLARRLIAGEPRIVVYQSTTLGAGVSFLVEALAGFSEMGPTSLEQADVFLQRLEHEMFTVLLASGLGKLTCRWRSVRERWRHRLKGLFGVTGAYRAAEDRSILEPLEDWPGRSTWQPPTSQTCDVLIEAFPSRTPASGLVRRLTALDFVRHVDTRRSIVASATMPGRFVAVHFVPEPEKVHQIGLWIRQQSA